MKLRELSQLLYQIKLSNQELTTHFEKDTGFSITRYEMLLFIKETGTVTQSDIQAKLKIDSAAITRHLKLLEEKKYVIRQRNKENNREVFVQLTKQAKQELEKCEDKYTQGKNPLAIPLTDDEVYQLVYLLKKLID